ncbi:MAG TPA: NfeD family protein [Rhodanobacteraceae bacterium]
MFGVPVHYWWWVLALLLMAGEVLAPRRLLLWIGIAAAVTGALAWALLPRWGAAAQVIAFVVLACVSCTAYWMLVRPRFSRGRVRGGRARQRLGAALLGQRCVLEEPIVNGRGTVRIAAGQWPVSGPDLPAGTEVEVVGVDGVSLTVKTVAG